MKSPGDVLNDPFSQFKSPSPSTAIPAQTATPQVSEPNPAPSIGSSIFNALDFGSKAYDVTHPNQDQSIDTLQKFLDDNSIEANKKREALRALNENPQDEEAIKSHIQDKYYSNSNFQLPTTHGFQMHETIPGSQTLEGMKFNDITDHPENYWTNIGKMGANAALNAGQLAIGGANLASTYGQELAKGIPDGKFNPLGTAYDTAVGGVINPALSGIQNEATKLGNTYDQSGVLSTAGQALKDTGKFASENPVTTATMADPLLARDVVAKTGENIASVPGNIAKTGEGTKQVITRTIPEKTIANNLNLNPTDIEAVQRITGKSPSQIVLENNLGGLSKSELADHYMKQANDSYQAINDQLANIKTTVPSESAKVAIGDMLETFDGLSTLEKNHYAPDIAYLKELLGKDSYTLSELNDIRRAFDKVNTGMYTAKGAMKGGTRTASEVGIRNKLSDDLQTEALKNSVDVRQMNENLRVGLAMKDGLIRRLAKDEKNNLVGLQDIGIMGVFAHGEPMTALSLGIGKKFLEAKAPSIAQSIYNTNKKPNAKSPLRRGNTISTNGGTSLFNRTNSVDTNSATSVPKVKKDLIKKKK